ncbi:M3 family oligoendopeptidase [Halanaerobacter jeridensis]|uniref:PepF/M3 family oligoendopeptidase n=1 Tax=Halanaerobacter jeridensis TaxID=706427 RepID=A0A939BQ29_9FIRM|nr:M3 family oligoendopeptidase [Halanaerobacter jeridensis]MBM7555864.1 pepF/M3 family oligoendopeptidase [Halanaerobacter jeridensis]
MEMRWNLEDLYTGFETDDFQEDFGQVDNKIEEINTWVEDNLNQQQDEVEQIEEFIELLREFRRKYSLLVKYAQLKLSVDANNNQAASYVEQLEKKETNLTKAKVSFQRWLGEINNLEEIITKSELLTEHKFYLKELAEQSNYLLSNQEEVTISKLQTTGSSAWYKLKQKLVSNLMVEITVDGEEQELPLSKVRNMAYDSDQAKRKKAYQAELDSYSKIEEPVASCLNSIKGESLTLSDRRGYESPLEKSLISSRLEQDVLDAMLEAMEESLPAFQKYYRKKAELLGHEDGLPFYDLFAPVGSAEMEFDYDEAKDFIVNNFRTFSDSLADYARRAFQENWIDAEPRAGKNGGAFCMNIHPLGQSRILANFEGSFSNVSTLAHELGHGFHGECLKEESIFNTDYPMPLAETASIFCETIIQKAALEEANQEQQLGILENSLMGAGQVIVDIYSRYLFEKEVFEKRKNSALAVEELKDLMVKAQKEAYGDGLGHDKLHPYMWVNKIHYYIPGFDFYNYPYAFGLLFGKGLYAQYQEQGASFVAEYQDLLAATGKKDAVEVAQMMDIDITEVDFWRQSLDIIKDDIEQFINHN